MNNISPGQLAEEWEHNGGQDLARARRVWVAWIATLLLSNLPLVIARDLLGKDIPMMTPLWITIAALLVGATFVWPWLKPLRGYFIIMGAIIVASFVVYPFVLHSAVWQGLFAGGAFMVSLFAERILLVVVTLGVLANLFLMGRERRGAFLTRGDLKAAVGGLRLPGGRQLSWAVFGPIMALLLAASFFSFLLGQVPRGASALGQALPWVLLIIGSAALNAFGEEAMYRAAPLAALLNAVGPRHAIWLTAVFFGLGHYYGGIPSGPVGFVQSGLLALLMGKAMLDTRGMGWAWIIHVAIDTVIYIVLAITQ